MPEIQTSFLHPFSYSWRSISAPKKKYLAPPLPKFPADTNPALFWPPPRPGRPPPSAPAWDFQLKTDSPPPPCRPGLPLPLPSRKKIKISETSTKYSSLRRRWTQFWGTIFAAFGALSVAKPPSANPCSKPLMCCDSRDPLKEHLWGQIWRVAGRESGYPELLGSPQTSPEVPQTSPEVFRRIPQKFSHCGTLQQSRGSPEVSQTSPEVPRTSPEASRTCPEVSPFSGKPDTFS